MSVESVPDPVAFWASMIVQEGKTAALEIADRCGVEAALDAVNYIAEERQRQWKEARAQAEALAKALDGLLATPEHEEMQAARSALRAFRESQDQA